MVTGEVTRLIAPPQTSTFPLCSQKNVYEQQMGSSSNPDLRSLGLREAEHPITTSKSGMPAQEPALGGVSVSALPSSLGQAGTLQSWGPRELGGAVGTMPCQAPQAARQWPWTSRGFGLCGAPTLGGVSDCFPLCPSASFRVRNGIA